MSIWIDALRPLLVTAAGMDRRDKIAFREKNSFAAQKILHKKLIHKNVAKKMVAASATPLTRGPQAISKISSSLIGDGDLSPRSRFLAAFSTPSTALHQSAALTLRGGSA